MFRSVNPEEDHIISISPPGAASFPFDLIFTLSRDRCLRVWDRQDGNIFSTRLPVSPGLADKESEAPGTRGSRASSVISGSNAAPGTPTHHLLGRERRNYVRCFFMSNTGPFLRDLRILVFIPTPHTPSCAGFFVLYRLSDPNSSSHKLVAVGEKEASERTVRCALRDFVVKISERVREIWLTPNHLFYLTKLIFSF